MAASMKPALMEIFFALPSLSEELFDLPHGFME